VIVGAGQTGLATAYFLGRAGVACLVLDEHQRVGDQWRQRYESLLLNSPAQYDGMPGLPFPAARGSYPTGAEMGDHLERYVEQMGIAVRAGVAVHSIDQQPDGTWLLTTSAGGLLADDVVVAGGAETRPHVPDFAAELDPGIRQLHSSGYRNPGQLLPGPVLVVGTGQSGADIALEIHKAGHEVVQSGRVTPEIPIPFGSRRMRVGLPVLWFMANRVFTVRTPIGRRMQPAIRRGGHAPLLRVRRADLVSAGVHVTEARAVGVDDGRPVLADGTVLDVANVVWCTGFLQDFGLVHPDVTGEDGYPPGSGVVEELPGLYYVGLLFQTAFSSMLIPGAGRDAKRIAAHIAARARV
jgi:putative flavoprotein involved in K+ transport